MLDIKWIRENPDAFNKAMEARGNECRATHLLDLDEQKRAFITSIQELQAQRNEVSQKVAMAKRNGENADELMQQSSDIASRIKELEEEADRVQFDLILSGVPNILDAEVPYGKDDSENVEVKKWGELPKFDFEPKQHFDLGANLGEMDFDQAAVMSGARFTILTGGLAKLERALSNFMIDNAAEFGYGEVSVPTIVKDKAMYGTGQLPKFSADAFRTEDGFWLIPTTEVPLANMVNGKILNEEELPIRVTTYGVCFRSEAGSAGRDTRGMIRQHQFKKIELVSITTPEQSEAEHNRMTDIEETVLQKLGLPYRKVLICSGDIGATARKQYDMEVWLPGQNAYREISSCSNCGDYQARRMQARYRSKEDKKNRFVHTLNGTALAIGRTMVAIMENYQQKDGSIKVPEVLVNYMGGMEVIKKK